MKNYIYKGQQPHLSTIIVDKKEVALSLHNGGEYTLPENNPTVASLVAQGLLVEKHSDQKQTKK